MRTVIIGSRGQLGTELVSLLGDDASPLTHDDIDIVDPAGVEAALTAARPDAVINSAAYNFVDRAEDEPASAFAVNALGPRNLALFCGQRNIPLVHVSTDYVFGLDADRCDPYRVTDAPGPLGAYGVSKLAGEQFVRGLCRRHFVLRTCGIYGRAARTKAGKGNFVETMLRLGGERKELRVVDDQRCTPTSAADLARAIAALIKTEAFGLYHATNAGGTTWCEFAREIFRLSQIDVNVVPTTTAAYGAKARRPHYSVLDNSVLTTTVGFELPDWRNALARYLAEREF